MNSSVCPCCVCPLLIGQSAGSSLWTEGAKGRPFQAPLASLSIVAVRLSVWHLAGAICFACSSVLRLMIGAIPAARPAVAAPKAE